MMFKHIFEDGGDGDDVESGGRDEEVGDAIEEDEADKPSAYSFFIVSSGQSQTYVWEWV